MPNHTQETLSTLRAEREADFLDAARDYIHAEFSGDFQLTALAHPKIEGLVGVAEERPADHIAARDIISITELIPDATANDAYDVFLTGEFGDEEATRRLAERLQQSSLAGPQGRLFLYSDGEACVRLYRAITTLFDDLDAELEFLNRHNDRLAAAGACVIAERAGRPWPEIFPCHNRPGTNVSRALVWAAMASGPEVLARWLKPILAAPRAKGRVFCADLPWDDFFHAQGNGKVTRVFRYQNIVLTESGKSHREIPFLPDRPRRAVKVGKTEEKGRLEFDKAVAKTRADGMVDPDLSDIETIASRAGGSLPSDYSLALMALGAPIMDLFWYRADPEELRRALVRGASFADNPMDVLKGLGGDFLSVQRGELAVRQGARARSSDRLQRAAERGELRMARLLVEAGAEVTEEIVAAAAPWPRTHHLLRRHLKA